MADSKPGLVFFRGEIIPYADARIHVMAPALKYGAAVYEGIRAYWNPDEEQLYVFRLQDHCKRLLNSIKAMRMESTFGVEELRDAVLDAVRANAFHQDLHIRQSVFVDGDGLVGATGPVGMSVVPLPKGRYVRLDGMDLCVSSWTRISDNVMPPRVKCCANYHNGRLAQLEAKINNYDAPLLLDGDGKVTEAPTASFFMIRNGVPITCPLTSGVLESITRETLIQLFREIYDLEVLVRPIDRTELYFADEAFLCGSGAEVAAVVSIDRQRLGDGKIGRVTQAIQKSYLDITRGINPDHSEWRTPIY